MYPQQIVQSRSPANGFNQRRNENKMENKSQPAKSNFNRIITGNKGDTGSQLRERLVYLTTCLIGHQVEVQVIDGSVYSGIFHATNAEKDFGIILKMARVTKTGSSRGQKSLLDSVQKPPSRTLIIPSKDLVQIVAKSVTVTMDGLMNEFQNDQMHDIMIDSSISQSRHVDLERELEPWVPDDDISELDNTFDRHWNRGWDQFEANATLFGVKSTFNEELYTTKLVRGPQMIEREKEALRIAKEIECEDTQDLHLAEERGIHFHDKFDLDEETKYSSVFRGVDDSGYDENEDILDSQNDETFGDVSDFIINNSFTDLTSGKSKNGSQLPSSFPTMIEVSDLLPSGLLDGQSSIQDNQSNKLHMGHNYTKEKHMVYEGNQAQKSDESSLGLNKEISGDKDKTLSATASAYAPTNVSSKTQEKANFSQVSETATATVKTTPASSAPASSTPASSAPSTSASGNVAPTAAASAPGLSPSSSMGSLTSEKSTLNPHAKEFRLNPKAKSFVPSSPAPLHAASPVSDTTPFYYPPPLPHMHGMPPGIGMGPSFPPHQPVLYGPQGTPLQSPQPYFHPNGPQYGGQQMVFGQPRPVVYMPTYPPERPYKGRDF